MNLHSSMRLSTLNLIHLMLKVHHKKVNKVRNIICASAIKIDRLEVRIDLMNH